MPHVEHVRRFCVEKGMGEAKLRTVRSRGRTREKDWSVHAGDPRGGGARRARSMAKMPHWQDAHRKQMARKEP
ncbi:hypothetical protein N7534_003660 [Penicillium rubens]|nr:hypothetical protein N7524_003746 [Penicillium chrysogenum]KAJ5858383.1 hypothetical protein N7534_003660 [Penicillium rubens]